MHRIDGDGATVDNLFTEGNPETATPATVVTAKWLNAIQEEVAKVVEEAGATLDDEDNAQLLAAINNLIAASIPTQVHVYDWGPDADNPGTQATIGSTSGRKPWAYQLADAATQGLIGWVNLPDPTKDWQLVIELAQASALTGKYVALKCEMLAIQEGEDPGANSADVSTTQAVACRNDANRLVVKDVNFRITSAMLHATSNILVRVGLWRIGGSSSPTDDHTGATNILRIYFEPVSA